MISDMMVSLGLGVAGMLSLFLGTFIGASVIGWVYEMLFYRLESGKWVRRGHGHGPWLPIYGFGALLVLIACWQFRENPFLVFLLSGLVTGLLEFVTGYVLFRFCNGTRLWDYNTERWNWGNVEGFVCARSVGLFALGGIALMSLGVPALVDAIHAAGGVPFLIATSIVGCVYAADGIWGYCVKGFVND